MHGKKRIGMSYIKKHQLMYREKVTLAKMICLCPRDTYPTGREGITLEDKGESSPGR